jgi:hypothetical protein
MRFGDASDLYRIFSTVLELQRPQLTSQLLTKFQAYQMKTAFPSYVWTDIGRYDPSLLYQYLSVDNNRQHIKYGLFGLIRRHDLSQIRQFVDQYHAENCLLDLDCFDSAVVGDGDPVETIRYLIDANETNIVENT